MLKEKMREFETLLRSYEKVCVAFSAGVDSSFLLDTANRVLPGNVMAVTATGCMVPEREIEAAKVFCEERQIPLTFIAANELDVPAFKQNAPDRCYHCKKNIFQRIQQCASENGFQKIVEGSNADDTGDYRPGMRALTELGIQSPMLKAGLTKSDIREMAHQRGVSTWNKPAGACLATRVPYGELITKELLQTIEEAEYRLFDAGIRGGRVRVHGLLARLEIPLENMNLFLEKRSDMVEAFKQLGFQHVCLDLEGYVKGSMNRTIVVEGRENGHN